MILIKEFVKNSRIISWIRYWWAGACGAVCPLGHETYKIKFRRCQQYMGHLGNHEHEVTLYSSHIWGPDKGELNDNS